MRGMCLRGNLASLRLRTERLDLRRFLRQFNPAFGSEIFAAFCGLVAQSVEQRPFKPLVLGSSPSQPTTLKYRGNPIFTAFRACLHRLSQSEGMAAIGDNT